MPLTLYFHPLSSYCHKVLIALYENATPFTPRLVNLGDREDAAAFKAIWPIGKFPVLADGERIVPESTPIIEYLARHYPGAWAPIPADADAAFEVRAVDRFWDLHVHTHMQKIIGDRIRPADRKDPFGVEHARAAMNVALGLAETRIATRRFAAGGDFTLADCAAAPALFYCDVGIAPLAESHPHLAAYLDRLKARPSYARVLAEAQPWMHMLPR
jgi:glutathione S-transferase